MKKILVIDDDKFFTEDIEMLLDFEDIPTEIVNSSDELFDRLPNISDYSSILLDIMFRRGKKLKDNSNLESGEVFFNLIREKNKKIPIIILTAKNKEELNIALDEKTYFFRKPLGDSISEIIGIIK